MSFLFHTIGRHVSLVHSLWARHGNFAQGIKREFFNIVFATRGPTCRRPAGQFARHRYYGSACYFEPRIYVTFYCSRTTVNRRHHRDNERIYLMKIQQYFTITEPTATSRHFPTKALHFYRPSPNNWNEICAQRNNWSEFISDKLCTALYISYMCLLYREQTKFCVSKFEFAKQRARAMSSFYLYN